MIVVVNALLTRARLQLAHTRAVGIMAAMSQSNISSRQRPLRVLYFIGSYGPDVMGNASHEETVLALRERGHAVEVITQVTDHDRPRFTRAVYQGVPVFNLNLSARQSMIARLTGHAASRLFQYEYLPFLVAAYRRHLRSRRYDLVHVEGAYPFGFVAAVGSGRTPFLVNVQGADVIRLPEADYGYRRYRVPDAAVRLVFKGAALVRAISPLLADYLAEEGLVQREKITVVLRSIEDEAFPPAGIETAAFRKNSREWLASKYGVGLDRPVVISLSRLHPFKGLEYMVDAIPAILAAQRDRGAPPPWFLICGPSRTTEHFGDYKDFLRSRAERLGVAQHVVFTGQVAHNEVRSHLAGAQVLICPSIIEAQNKVVPEACAVGTPSVVTETTGITSYLAPLAACVSVRPRSAQAISSSVSRLLGDAVFYEETKRNAIVAAETLRKEVLTPQLESVWYRAAGALS